MNTHEGDIINAKMAFINLRHNMMVGCHIFLIESSLYSLVSSSLQPCDERQINVYDKVDRLRAHTYSLMKSKEMYVSLLCSCHLTVHKAKVKVQIKQQKKKKQHIFHSSVFVLAVSSSF